MKTVKFVNNYMELASAGYSKKHFVFEDGHITEAFNWHRDDVIQQAGDEKTLTLDEIDYVLYRMVDNHDACIGVNWDVIECYIDEIMSAREKDVEL